MTYLSWAALYEGPSDQAYFEILIPRVMEDIIRQRGARNATIPPAPAVRFRRDSVEAVAREACEARDAFHLVFIHADTGGRNLEAAIDHRSSNYCAAMKRACEWPPPRCIMIKPRPETETWVLADPQAVTAALGYRGGPQSIGLPGDAKAAGRLPDPKQVLAEAVRRVRRRARAADVAQIFPAIAQRQSLTALRQAPSFAAFDASVVAALTHLGCL